MRPIALFLAKMLAVEVIWQIVAFVTLLWMGAPPHRGDSPILELILLFPLPMIAANLVARFRVPAATSAQSLALLAGIVAGPFIALIPSALIFWSLCNIGKFCPDLLPS